MFNIIHMKLLHSKGKQAIREHRLMQWLGILLFWMVDNTVVRHLTLFYRSFTKLCIHTLLFPLVLESNPALVK